MTGPSPHPLKCKFELGATRAVAAAWAALGTEWLRRLREGGIDIASYDPQKYVREAIISLAGMKTGDRCSFPWLRNGRAGWRLLL